MAARYRFGGVEFDAASGELRPLGTRLPRQPSRLLALLVEKRGGVVSHEEIREKLWSDTTVEYDKSLHFCIHQIRTALGDSASEPRFVETLPRQGYRLIPEVQVLSGRRTWHRLWLVVAIVAVVVIGWLVVPDEPGTPVPARPRPLRLGVMPFVPPAGWSHGEVPKIAEWILEELTTLSGNRVSIVGPATTAAFDLPGRALHDLTEEYDLDYVVNGRFLPDADPPSMLAELIRTEDGAHVWVRRYERLDDGRRIGLEISAEVRDRLQLQDGE